MILSSWWICILLKNYYLLTINQAEILQYFLIQLFTILVFMSPVSSQGSCIFLELLFLRRCFLVLVWLYLYPLYEAFLLNSDVLFFSFIKPSTHAALCMSIYFGYWFKVGLFFSFLFWLKFVQPFLIIWKIHVFCQKIFSIFVLA